MIICPIRIESRLSPGYEVSFGRSSTRVGWLGAENNCYLLHYYVILSYHIILSYIIYDIIYIYYI